MAEPQIHVVTDQAPDQDSCSYSIEDLPHGEQRNGKSLEELVEEERSRTHAAFNDEIGPEQDPQTVLQVLQALRSQYVDIREAQWLSFAVLHPLLSLRVNQLVQHLTALHDLLFPLKERNSAWPLKQMYVSLWTRKLSKVIRLDSPYATWHERLTILRGTILGVFEAWAAVQKVITQTDGTVCSLKDLEGSTIRLQAEFEPKLAWIDRILAAEKEDAEGMVQTNFRKPPHNF